MKTLYVIDQANKVSRKSMQDGPAVLCLVDNEGDVLLSWDQNSGHKRTITYRELDKAKLNPVVSYTLGLDTLNTLVQAAYEKGSKDRKEETQEMLRGIFGIK